VPTYITDKYAVILTKDDVGQLFNALVLMLHGNRSEAARQCDLTGKTTYDWEKAEYVKLETKRKVLEACLKMDFLGTTEYLLERSSERTLDVLRTILSTIYTEAVETDFKDQFTTLLNRFLTLRSKHRGLIRDNILDETEDMLSMLKHKASELEAPIPIKSIEDMSAKELLDVFPLITDTYLKNPQEAPAIARALDLPLESIEMLWSTFEKFHLIGESVSQAELLISPELNWLQLSPSIQIRWSEEQAPTGLLSCFGMNRRVGRRQAVVPQVEDANKQFEMAGAVVSDSQAFVMTHPFKR